MAQSVSMIHETIELNKRMRAYAIRVAMLFPHLLPQEPQTALHVAAPQHDAATAQILPTLGTAMSGMERSAPMIAVLSLLLWRRQRRAVAVPVTSARTRPGTAQSLGASCGPPYLRLGLHPECLSLS